MIKWQAEQDNYDFEILVCVGSGVGGGCGAGDKPSQAAGWKWHKKKSILGPFFQKK